MGISQFVGSTWTAVLYIVLLPGVGVGSWWLCTLVLNHVLGECCTLVFSEVAPSCLEVFQPLLMGAGSGVGAWFPALVLLDCVDEADISRF